MFSLYRLEEIFQTLKQHRTRNILTGFGVAWGIFILVLLVAVGSSLQSNVGKVFSGYASNVIWVWSGSTSVASASGKKGESIHFDEYLTKDLKNYFNEIEYLSPSLSYGFGSSVQISYEDKNMSTQLEGVYPEYFKIRILDFKEGRRLDRLDMETRRPVCILGSEVAKILFGDANAIGKYVRIFDAWFKVVGVLDEGSNMNNNERNKTIIPFSSFQSLFNQGVNFSSFSLSVRNGVNGSDFEEKLRAYLAARLHFDKDDKQAVGTYNLDKDIQNFNMVFGGIQIFLWAIGICLLLTGMVGISNMMLVVVKERTREIGIRKAIGATPRDVLSMILYETIVITLLAGSVGLLLATSVVKLANQVIASHAGKNFIFKDLSVNMSVALASLVILVVSGCIAGIVPAKKATKIVPVEALNTEN